MRPILASLIDDKNILSASKKTVFVPFACETPTGNLNVYEITKEGLETLTTGFVGMGGFELCENEETFLEKNVQQTTLNELIGHSVRVYEDGDIITKEFRSKRINFVTKDGIIMYSYFG